MKNRWVAGTVVALVAAWAACTSNPAPGDAVDTSSRQDAGTSDLAPDFEAQPDSLPDLAPAKCTGPGITAITHATVIPMVTETSLADHTVVVSGGIICATGPSDSVVVPPGAVVIDGTGRFLIPGLTDMHIHLNFETDLILYLANGVTTVRNMWGFPWTLELQHKIANSEIHGPELFTTGPIMDGDPPVWAGSQTVTTPEQATQSVEEQIEAGFSMMKVYARLQPDVYAAIIETAGLHDIPVVGHVPDAVGLENALNAGQHSIEHLTGYDFYAADGTAEELTAQNGVWNCPTLVVFKQYANIDQLSLQGTEGMQYVHPQTIAYWQNAATWEPVPLDKLAQKVALLNQKGAGILAGTDATNPYVVPGFSLHEELALLNQAGLSNWEVLRSATLGPAQSLGTAMRSGTIEDGKDADLVLLEDNPLENISATRSIAGVMVKGQWWPNEKLQEKLDDQAEMFQAQYSLDFDCPLPPEYEVAPEGDRVLFKARGEISEFGSDCFASREFQVVIDGEEWDVDSYSACATSQFLYALEYVGVSTFSTAQLLGPGHVGYRFLSAAVSRLTLQKLKSDDQYELATKPNHLFVAAMEMKSAGTDQLFKMCPVAVAAQGQPDSSLFVCHDNNDTFAVGETLQMAGRIALSTDQELIQNTLFMDGPCNCWKNQYDELDCDQFEAQ